MPIKRSKPPWTTIDFSPEGIRPWVEEFEQVNYLALSNVESPDDFAMYMKVFPNLQIIPKIESVQAVANIDAILSESSIQIVMIDHDDLYTNARYYGEDVNVLIERVKAACKAANRKSVMAAGVVFEETDPEPRKSMAYLCARVENAPVDPTPAIKFADSLGMDLWIPKDSVTEPRFPIGAYECKEAIDNSVAIICIPPIGRDCAWELGYAIGCNKKVYVLGDLAPMDWMTKIGAEIVDGSV
ncbi:MAG: aldolase/citrate lyase family protein [Candidatus Hermodarchaeia archaeon]